MILVMLVQWAESYASELLRPLGDRWVHTREVARQAGRVARTLPGRDRDLLVATAYLHDVGYAPGVVETGFHPLDGAVHLKELEVNQRVCCLVAHHSAARYEAEERSLSSELDEFDREEGPVMDALTYADMMTGAAGEPVGFNDRMNEILGRYGPEDPVARVIRGSAKPALSAAVDRTASRMARKVNQPI